MILAKSWEVQPEIYLKPWPYLQPTLIQREYSIFLIIQSGEWVFI